MKPTLLGFKAELWTCTGIITHAQQQAQKIMILANLMSLYYTMLTIHRVFTNTQGTFQCPYSFIHNEFSVKQCLQAGSFCTGYGFP